MNRFVKRTAAMLLPAAAVLISLTSCLGPAAAPSPDVSDSPSPSATAASFGAIDHMFTIRYDADHSLNPITGTDPNNMVLAPLMYEGLFVLNTKMEAEPVLCDTYETSDGITYTVKLKSGVAMSDGSTLTAADVKYTLLTARQSGRFTGRLKIIDNVTTVDSLTLKITLSAANYMLPALLDVPIIKANSGNQNHPPGTGPYTFAQSGDVRLVASSSYRDAASIPAPVIYLKSCSDADLSIDFSSQAVDMYWDDPADASDLNIRSDHEIRYYDTTILEYVGFNTSKKVLSYANLRRALGMTIDRSKIIDNVYLNHGVAAPLVLSPKLSIYSPEWETKSADTLGDISAIFHTIGSDPDGLSDTNGDGFLEFMDSNGNWVPITLTFIVNNDNRYKVQAAEEIANAMKEVGINVTLSPEPWDVYVSDLQAGKFDLFYGDVSLPADYDLSELLSPGGTLDFGHAANATYAEKINDFLGTSEEASHKDAARQMCEYIYENAPIVPVLYRQYAVHTNRNIVTGLNPTQSSLFYGLTNWKINLG